MKKNIYILVTIISASILLVACAGGAASDSAEVEASSEDEPQFAFYAVNSEPLTNWDPAIEFSNGIHVDNNMYEQLVRYDSASESITPLLAETYAVSDDGLTWTFNLRQGVKFQNGDDFTAEDVKYSIDRTMRLGAGAAYIWSAVTEVNVVDDYTVEFVLGYETPLDLVAATGYAAFIYSDQCVDENDAWIDESIGCGTGPYMLKSAKWGDEVILEKFEDYWGGWSGEHFDLVVFKKVTEPATRRQMIETGEATITIELPYSDIDALKENSDVAVFIEPSWQNLIGMYNTQKAPLDNVLVRQALSYAFPYDQVIEHAAGGYARQSYSIVPYGMWGFSDELPRYTYDLDKAQELLEEAGYADGGFDMLLTYTAGNETEKSTAELYKSELAKLNINLEIRSMPWDSQWELAKSPNPDDRQDIILFYWWPDLPSPYSFLFSTFHSEEEILFNLSYYYNPEFDALIDEANMKTASDYETAEAMFIEAQEILLEDAVSLFIYDRQDVWPVNSKLEGFKFNPAYPTTVFFYETYLGE